MIAHALGSRVRHAPATLRDVLVRLRRGFAAFRHTRPFWGAAWTVAAGLWLIRSTRFTLMVSVNHTDARWSSFFIAGAMLALAVTALAAPVYRSLLGFLIFVLALLAFPLASLGGYLIGTVLGLLGGAMIWSWGPLRRTDRDVPKPAPEAEQAGSQ